MAHSRRRKPRATNRPGQRQVPKREWRLRDSAGLVIASGLFLAVFGWALTRGANNSPADYVAPVVEQFSAASARADKHSPAISNAVSFSARVVGVTDGDTITVLDERNQQHTIRLAEIDAPERGQPWGDKAKQTLSALVFSKAVSIQQTDTDRYGRVVARVFADGQDVNRAMVEQGAAWAYREYLTDQTLNATETRARDARKGLWSMNDTQTVAPWEWRRGTREGGQLAPIDETVTPVRSLLSQPSAATDIRSLSDTTFSCSGKRYCRQMSSCAEANYYLQVCGVSSLDGNSDGEPCEMLCGTAG